ncbi:MAG: ferrous iron transporter B, partial [Victivallales bacterium]|nr:ferrous iron transporter B [Victivallales bacterium]
YFEDEESGEIDHTETIGYEEYLENKKTAAEDNEPDPSQYGLWIPGIPGLVESLLDKVGTNDFFKSLILDGIIGGVGTGFGFLPQILIVFLFLAFLEDCGYMARVAFIMDRVFRRFGLSGKSFIPMLVGTGCGVPAVLATRTIENDKDRRMTIILSTFLPCGAKVAIIAMIVAAFFPDSNLVGPSMYFIGIGIVILGGIALKKTRAFAGEAAPFVMELPAYHMPSLKGVLIHTWERGKGYAIKAGTIIFAACIVLWLLMHFDWGFNLLDPESAEGLEQCRFTTSGCASPGFSVRWALAVGRARSPASPPKSPRSRRRPRWPCCLRMWRAVRSRASRRCSPAWCRRPLRSRPCARCTRR